MNRIVNISYRVVAATAMLLAVSCAKSKVDDGQSLGRLPQVTTLPDFMGINQTLSVGGHKLNLVTKMVIGDMVYEQSDFIDQYIAEIVVKIPDNSKFVPGDNKLDIKLFYELDGAKSEIVSDKRLNVVIPKVTSSPGQTAGVYVKADAEIQFEGIGLTLLDSMRFGPLKVVDYYKQKYALFDFDVPFSSTGGYGFTGDGTVDVVGYYGGELKKEVVLVKNFNVNTIPEVLTEPKNVKVYADNGYYLAKEVVIKGKGIDLIKTVKLGDLEAEIVSKTAKVLTFKVPEEYAFNTATSCKLEVIYGKEDKIMVLNDGIMVYPFYYWKNVVMSVGSDNGNINKYDQTGADMAFLSLDTGEPISTTQFIEQKWDPYYSVTEDNPVMAGANKIDKSKITKEQYYAIKPYISFVSQGQINFAGPAKDGALMGSFKYKKDGAWMPARKTWGTLVYGLASVNYTGSPAALMAYADSVRNGTIQSLLGLNQSLGSSGPKLQTAACTANGQFNAVAPSNVIAFGWAAYDEAAEGKVGVSGGNYHKIGFIVIKNVTNLNADSKIVEVDGILSSRITIDVFWPHNTKKN